MRIPDCGFWITEESMNQEELKARTRAFALRIIRLAESLPDSPTAKVVRNQMIRCGTSVGANYRAACRARSKADFVSKMGIVEEETDETIYWMELLVDADIVKRPRIADLLDEADQILSIVISSINCEGNPSESAISNQQSAIVCVIG
jgi:four helix bundle protein